MNAARGLRARRHQGHRAGAGRWPAWTPARSSSSWPRPPTSSKAGKLDEAIAAYRDVLTRVPALTSVHLQLGVLFERKGDTAAAVAEYQAALKADPANAKARAALDRLARY